MATFLYCFIRKDLSEEQRIIQMSHACFEAGKVFGERTDVPPHICLFEVADEEALFEVSKYLRSKNVKYEIFYEPDKSMYWTSICSEPVEDEEKRSVFADFKLYRAANGQLADKVSTVS
jgi:hypothetical protein